MEQLKVFRAVKDYLRLRIMPDRPKSYFKYVNAHIAKVILVTQKLRWSSPLLFNDPFDVQRDFDFGHDDETVKELIVQELRKLLSADKVADLPENSRIKWFVNHLRRADRADVRKTIIDELPRLIDEGMQHAKEGTLQGIKKMWSAFLPEFRILCLSAINDSVLMWSHYSDSHRGVMLEFCPTDDSSFLWAALPVTYQDSPPTLTTQEEWVKFMAGQMSLDVDSWHFYEPFVLTKTKSWEYEKEWRVVSFMRSRESGLYSDYPFNPRELRSIYLGCEATKEDTDDILSLLKYDLAHVVAWCGRKSKRERIVHFERFSS